MRLEFDDEQSLLQATARDFAARERARQVTDELLRYDTPVMTVAYYAGDGAAVAGRPLEPGSLCTVILGAANHDSRVFDAPMCWTCPDIAPVPRCRSATEPTTA